MSAPGSRYSIRHEVSEKSGQYLVDLGLTEATLSYTISSPTMLIADKLQLGGTINGSSLPAALVARLVEDARAEGRRIIALCPLVKEEARKTPDYDDVFSWE